MKYSINAVCGNWFYSDEGEDKQDLLQKLTDSLTPEDRLKIREREGEHEITVTMQEYCETCHTWRTIKSFKELL